MPPSGTPSGESARAVFGPADGRREDFAIHLSHHRTPESDREELLRDPGWGRVFTDHMVTIAFEPGRGWHDAALRPFGPLSLPPSTSVFHYGQAVFEGLKAYRQPDDSVAAFRPRVNARRLADSARRLAMPELPEDLFLAAIQLLVEYDLAWVPRQPGHALYLRPLEIAVDAELMTRPSRRYLFTVMASPVASYFPRGVQPVTVWLNTDYPRAAVGGTGAAKFAGNYAGAMLGQSLASEQGCDQVVWLDATEHRFVEELGGMNLFFVTADNRLMTPPLTDTILPGVTRDSILRLGRELGLTTQERAFSIDEWQETARSGALSEAFACGTAAVVTPIGTVKHDNGSFTIGQAQAGPVALALRERLLAIQQGAAPDVHHWMHPLVSAGPEARMNPTSTAGRW